MSAESSFGCVPRTGALTARSCDPGRDQSSGRADDLEAVARPVSGARAGVTCERELAWRRGRDRGRARRRHRSRLRAPLASLRYLPRCKPPQRVRAPLVRVADQLPPLQLGHPNADRRPRGPRTDHRNRRRPLPRSRCAFHVDPAAVGSTGRSGPPSAESWPRPRRDRDRDGPRSRGLAGRAEPHHCRPCPG